MTIVRIQPTMLYFDGSLNFLLVVSPNYPSIKFLCQQHSEAMNNECEIFIIQLNQWINNEKIGSVACQ